MASAVVAVPLVLLVDYAGGWIFGAVLAAAAVLGTLEFSSMLVKMDRRPLLMASLPTSAFLAAMPLFVTHPQNVWIGVIVLALGGLGAWCLVPGFHRSGLLDWAVTLLGILYIGLLLGHLGLLRQFHHGARWVAIALVITWAYDTGAFFAGSWWGRHGFMTHVSPSKTIQGVLGGLSLSTCSALVGVPAVGLAVWQALLLGLLGGAVAQIGDLAESMIKRQAGVKDSGSIMPGHGGLLDRIDGLLFTGTLTAYAALLFGYGS